MKENMSGEKTKMNEKKLTEKEIIEKDFIEMELQKEIKNVKDIKKEIKNVKFNDILKSYSFEQASKELDEVISKLEIGNLNLEDSIKLYEKGALLIEHCNNNLNRLTGVITIIKDKIEKSFEAKIKPTENDAF